MEVKWIYNYLVSFMDFWTKKMEGVLLEKRRKRKSRLKVYACCLEKPLMHAFIKSV